ncbi:MAG: serine/threonine-protein phosphatase, partial [Nitrospirae bacterium]|nr:serine/threonine-protein phosphatase [Nitrospirota bacterium]
MTLWGRSTKNSGAVAIADSLQFGSLTDVGVVRSENQDAMGFRVPDDPEDVAGKGALFVVADGMGGHKGGATASRLAVKTILDRYFNSRAGEPGDRIRSAIEAANRAVLLKSQSDKGLDGMGTTVVALVVRPPNAYVAHVGDSRAYVVRNGAIRQITKDHSLVQQWVDQGVM